MKKGESGWFGKEKNHRIDMPETLNVPGELLWRPLVSRVSPLGDCQGRGTPRSLPQDLHAARSFMLCALGDFKGAVSEWESENMPTTFPKPEQEASGKWLLTHCPVVH